MKPITPKHTIPQREFIDCLKGIWMANDYQLNCWQTIKNFCKENGFFVRDLKKSITNVVDLLRKNTPTSLWKDFDKKDFNIIFDYTGELQDAMERAVHDAFDIAIGTGNHFLVQHRTDFGMGDMCWIRREGGEFINVEILGARCTHRFSRDEAGMPVSDTEFIVEVQPYNKDGKPYSEPFWVNHDNIAKHKKELK